MPAETTRMERGAEHLDGSLCEQPALSQPLLIHHFPVVPLEDTPV